MEYRRQVCRILHDEHVVVIGLLERFSSFLIETGTTTPDADDPVARRMLTDVAIAVESEITAHFAFEEQDLFPLLAASGYGDLGDSLAGDHDDILPRGREVAARARTACAEGFTNEAWTTFARLGAEFAERLIDHARNEETGLLPVLELAIDDETDGRLVGDYAMKR
jgi:hypothetical protein